MQRFTTITTALMLVPCLVMSAPLSANAQQADTAPTPKTCETEAVSARGEPATFTWLARSKTKANWRAKVRAMTGLGDPYANWDRAENRDENCKEVAKGIACEFTGIPCRKGITSTHAIPDK